MYVCMYVCTYVYVYVYVWLMSNYYQKLEMENEGNTGANGAGRSIAGACDLHCPMWIKKRTNKKLSPETQLVNI